MMISKTSTKNPKGVLRVLTVVSPEAPISVNAMYSQSRAGRMFLTREGKAFKDHLRSMVAQSCLHADWGRASVDIYRLGGTALLHVDLQLPNLRNSSWKPGKLVLTPSGSPRSPYKKLDGHNYVKIIADAVGEGTGIDDSLLKGSSEEKDFAWSGPPQVTITLQVWIPDGDGADSDQPDGAGR